MFTFKGLGICACAPIVGKPPLLKSFLLLTFFCDRTGLRISIPYDGAGGKMPNGSFKALLIPNPAIPAPKN
tara:strand:+ start:222 stop:434 length:213 start_codon:yes stop_codon:yes gene_type:complete